MGGMKVRNKFFLKYRRINQRKQGAYSIVNKFWLKRINLVCGRLEWILMRRDNARSPGGVVCPLPRVFDAIYWTHYRCAHGKVSQTHKVVQLIYWNLTEREVKTFITLCPSCNLEKPLISPMKGSVKPIRSAQFLDRVQVDLICSLIPKDTNDDFLKEGSDSLLTFF
jgi:hypothetical protein